jgi:hypothetical protein
METQKMLNTQQDSTKINSLPPMCDSSPFGSTKRVKSILEMLDKTIVMFQSRGHLRPESLLLFHSQWLVLWESIDLKKRPTDQLMRYKGITLRSYKNVAQ